MAPEAEQPQYETVAAVDLGSNSFHMIVARSVEGHLHVIDKMRERVALATGLDERRMLTPEIQARALDCLRRFGQRLWGLPSNRVRAVGTHALRTAKNSRSFLPQALKVLGHPIEIISGNEEARLTYLGVAHGLPGIGGRRLVVDIGGGSTECILGDGLTPSHTDSLAMGAVTYSQRFFPDGRLSQRNMKRAILAARAELQAITSYYRAFGFKACIGSSGTMVNVEAICIASGWSESGITAEALVKLREALDAAGEPSRLTLPKLQPDRAGVIAGGVAIIQAIFDSFHPERITASQSALREGVLYDLLGRIHHEDERDRTIARFVERYHVDLAQAGRVERTAVEALEQVARSWDLELEPSRQVLSWAAKLHEIGLTVSFNGHHKHGAYLVQHADMPGFSRADQDLLAFLLLNHRRKLRLEPAPGEPELPEHRSASALKLCVLLRLAVCLNHSRRNSAIVQHTYRASGQKLSVSFPAGWLEKHPLTQYDLEMEAEALKRAGVELVVGG